MRFRFSRRAESDLKEIAAYIARDNPARAVTFAQRLREHCRGLVAFPEARRLRPELGEGVRLSVFGNYFVHEDILEVRRVMHGALDIAGID